YAPQDKLTISMWAYTEFFNGLLGLVVSPWNDVGDICVEYCGDGVIECNNKDLKTNMKSVNPVVEGEWTYITYVYDNVEKYTAVYYNGELENRVDYEENMGQLDINQFAVGAFYYGTSPKDGGTPIRILPGAMDDVRIYNRALSQEEIKQLMNGEEPTAPVAETPAVEEPVVEEPAVEEPVVEEPVVEEPVVEEPKEEVVETPAVEEVVETPAVEEPAAPQTFDAAVIAAVSALVAAAGYAVSKKRR
ncbi:MAG: LamG domain-containing protein, partial [Clostridia bacterium]|nr:LamG domain-containing protein [Clostridia bacterium]